MVNYLHQTKGGCILEKNNFTDLLFDAILTLKTRQECYDFFGDACTPKEISAIAQRFSVAKMLSEKRIYNDIIKETRASTATISRVSRSMNDGFALAIERLKNE